MVACNINFYGAILDYAVFYVSAAFTCTNARSILYQRLSNLPSTHASEDPQPHPRALDPLAITLVIRILRGLESNTCAIPNACTISDHVNLGAVEQLPCPAPEPLNDPYTERTCSGCIAARHRDVLPPRQRYVLPRLRCSRSHPGRSLAYDTATPRTALQFQGRPVASHTVVTSLLACRGRDA